MAGKMSFVNFMSEGRRLRNKYPLATDVIRLSDLYPSVDDYYDCALAVKKDEVGTKLKIFEEKNYDGFIRDSLIPISYRSDYGRCVAYAIRDIMKENEAFARAFLGKYNKIVLDSNAVDSPGVFVIGNYSDNVSIDGYSVSDFVKAVLKPYGIDSFDYSELIHRLSSKNDEDTYADSCYAKLDFYKLLTEGSLDFETLAYYYITNKKYDELKFLLDNRQNTKKINKRVLSDMPIDALNCFLDYAPSVMKENADVLKPAIDDIVLTVRRSSQFGDIESAVPMDFSDSLKLTSVILRELDPSGKLNDSFSLALQDGKLMSYEKVDADKSDYVLYKEVDGNLEKVSIPENCYFSDCINVCPSGTLSDVFELINGFTHYYINSKQGLLEGDFEFISDVIPTYFEARCGNLLIQHGFPRDEVIRVLNARKADCLGTAKINGTAVMVDLINKKNNFGSLSMDTVLSDKEVQGNILFRQNRKMPPLSETAIRKNYAAGCCEMLFDSKVKYDSNMIGCALGYHFAKKHDEEMDQRMIWAVEHCDGKDYEPEQIVELLRTGKTHIRKKTFTTPTYSSSQEMDDMFETSPINYNKGSVTRKK